MYVAEVESFTHKNKNQVIVSKKYISPEDNVLIIDDFLANGKAKHNAVKALLTDEINTNVPATMLKVHSDVVLICDKAAYYGE